MDQQLQFYTTEEENAIKSLEEAKSRYNEEMRAIEKTSRDLNHGLKFYSMLGLRFEKAEGDCMKFVFTQIDPSEPLKEFFFLMLVDEQNMYRISGEPSPKLPIHCQSLCALYLDNLNSDNNIGRFVFLMRRLFCDLFSPKGAN